MTADELRPLLEAERVADPADQAILDNSRLAAAEMEPVESDRGDFEAANMGNPEPAAEMGAETLTTPDTAEVKATDPFDEIDFGSYFDDYLDPGYKSPASENVEKPSFETFLSSPVTLSDHLHSQLALVSLTEEVRDAAESIIGNLNENGYLTTTPEEMAAAENHKLEDVFEALRVVHTLDPAGVGSANLQRMPAAPDREPQRQGRSRPGKSCTTI